MSVPLDRIRTRPPGTPGARILQAAAHLILLMSHCPSLPLFVVVARARTAAPTNAKTPSSG
jgi:hypothetical protein